MRILFALALMLLCTSCAYAAQELHHDLVTVCPSVVQISPDSLRLSGTINPIDGSISSMAGKFRLVTNDNDAHYDFIVMSQVQTSDGGLQNAYYLDVNAGDSIILVNTAVDKLPSRANIDNIKSGNPKADLNPNAIAYPISSSISSEFESITKSNDAAYSGVHYKVKNGSAQSGIVSQSLGINPNFGTYSLSDDEPGTYEAIVTLSAYAKP